MSTVIYLSNQQIQIVEGKRGKTAYVSRCFDYPTPQGSIINGIIMDQEGFGSFIKGIWSDNKLSVKDVILVVNSTKFVGQNMEIPKMSDEKTLDHIKRGFSNIDRSEEKVYGFVRLESSQKKMQRLYAESVSPDFVKDYIDFFQGIGITLKGIYSGEGSTIGLINSTKAKQLGTFMLMIADSMTLTTILYVNKVFTYYNSARCFHEQGTEDYAQDLTRSVSQIRQFMQAQQLDSELESIVLAGMDEKDLNLYKAQMRDFGVQTPIEIFSDAKSIKGAGASEVQSHLFATSGLFDNGANGNYLVRYQTKKVEKKEGSNAKYFIILTIALVVSVGGFILALLRTKSIKNQLEELEAYNNSAAIQMQVEEYDELTMRNSFLIGQYLSIANINENLDTYPWATSKVQSKMFKLADGYATFSITSCNADSGTTNMDVYASNVQTINEFITIMKSQSIFHNVTYSGYNYSEEDKYHVNMSCTLEEAVGRGGDTDED